MCGIAGYVNFNKTLSPDINTMLNSLKHRGPDNINFKQFTFDNCDISLGHVRLSIIDLSEFANQPMSDDLGEIHIIFNGEIYNFQEIKRELEGCAFKTNSDTEAILYAYKQWGVDCVRRFVGMFSIVIFDEIKNKIIFINDRLGVKPLYIYEFNGLVIFASELKAILQYENLNKKINTQALTQFMQYGYIQPPLCIFENIFKIEPGTVIELNLLTRTKSLHKYWSIEDSVDIAKKMDLEILEKGMLKAFEYRMVSDVPVCLFLSSGVDSSLVASVLAKKYNINTITIGVNDKKYNEAPEAMEISSFLKTHHVQKYIDGLEILDLIDAVAFCYDEPFSDSSMYPTYLIAKIAQQNGYKVALSSDGGDEAFGGYSRYLYLQKYSRIILFIPFLIRKFLGIFISSLYKIGFLKILNYQMISLKVKKIINSLESKNISEFYENINKCILDKRVKQILKNADINNGYFSIFDYINKKNNNDILNTAMAIDYKTYVYQILTKIDRASMANSVEVREPLLDHHIIEYMINIDSGDKINGKNTKIPAKNILKKYLNLDLLSKNKKGFSIPIDTWLKNDLKQLVEKYTSRQAIEESDVFDYEEVLNIKSKFLNGKTDHLEIWHIFIFQLWYNTWVKKIA